MMQNHPTLLALILDGLAAGTDNGRAGFNSPARIGVRIVQAAPPSRGIFLAVNTIVASSMGGRSLVGIFGCERFLNTLTPTTLLRLPTSIGVEWQANLACSGALNMPSHVRTLFQYLTLAIAVIAFERNTPFIVVALAVAVFLLSHVIGGRNHG